MEHVQRADETQTDTFWYYIRGYQKFLKSRVEYYEKELLSRNENLNMIVVKQHLDRYTEQYNFVTNLIKDYLEKPFMYADYHYFHKMLYD